MPYENARVFRNIMAALTWTNYEAMVFIYPDQFTESHILGILARALIVFHPVA